MNKKFINLFLAIILILGSISCKDMLVESPKSTVTPDFFNSTLGLQSGVVASYSGLRWITGTDGAICNSNLGTDEFQSTDALSGDQAQCDTYGTNFAASNGTASGPWSTIFTYINTCNGVIDYGTVSTSPGVATVRKQLLAEAHFLRGYYYYILTMYYGAVPLDLGSGKLKFNLKPTITSVRDSRADVFDAIIADFTYAKDSLPNKPVLPGTTNAAPGRVGKAAALHYLAKAYLSRASLGIGNAAADYTSAYTQAMALINNQSIYGVSLTQDFANVNLEGHENDPEVLFNVQRTWTSSGPNLNFDEANDGTSAQAVANKGNRSNFFFTAGYENVKIKKLVNGTSTDFAIVPRSIPYQRPWRMIMPTKWLIFNAFADKVNDARFDGSFRMSWNAGTDFTVKGRTVKTGNLAIQLTLNDTETAAPEDSVGANGVIYKPYALYYWGMLYNANGTYKLGGVQYIYPDLKKFDDTKRADKNYDSNRPIILARLAETYLIAAEAIMGTDKTEAARLINVVRERAAYRPGISDLATRKAAMDITATDVTIDFILDERSREFCGEGQRWYDLMRTGKLHERAALYNNKAAANLNADVSKHFLLHPIPQTMIDGLDVALKSTYQNPGY